MTHVRLQDLHDSVLAQIWSRRAFMMRAPLRHSWDWIGYHLHAAKWPRPVPNCPCSKSSSPTCGCWSCHVNQAWGGCTMEWRGGGRSGGRPKVKTVAGETLVACFQRPPQRKHAPQVLIWGGRGVWFVRCDDPIQ